MEHGSKIFSPPKGSTVNGYHELLCDVLSHNRGFLDADLKKNMKHAWMSQSLWINVSEGVCVKMKLKVKFFN